MRLSDLLSARVVTESGESLGRVFDVRAHRRGRTLEATGLVVGRRGLAERYGIGSSRGERNRHHKVWHGDFVPWDGVVRLDRGRIVVRDGTKPE